MKRSEFLKRLGLGAVAAVAAVAAPALLAREENEPKTSGKGRFRPGDETAKSTPIRGQSEPAYDGKTFYFKQYDSQWKLLSSTACVNLEIPPLEKGTYKYEMTFEDKPILSGNIISK